MTTPLALLLYDKLIPGTQVLHRLQDLQYRTAVVHHPDALIDETRREKPMIIFTDLVSNRGDVCAAIALIRGTAETAHVPIVAFAPEAEAKLQECARQAGATLVVSESTILQHLRQFLEQALALD